jgi:hypothetical protein
VSDRAIVRSDAIYVLGTTLEATRVALSTAVTLARGSGSRLIVMVPRVVSYAHPSAAAADATEFTMRQYSDLVQALDGDAQVRLCVCRRLDDVVRHLIPRGAIVVIAGSAGGWRRSTEAKVVQRLAALGHHVVFVPMPRGSAASRISA